MAQIGDLTIDLKVILSAEQAERAIKIVEWFLNDNPDYRIYESIIKRRDGTEYRNLSIGMR